MYIIANDHGWKKQNGIYKTLLHPTLWGLCVEKFARAKMADYAKFDVLVVTLCTAGRIVSAQAGLMEAQLLNNNPWLNYRVSKNFGYSIKIGK